MEKNFTKIRSIKDYLISSLLILGGVICIIIPSGVSINILGALLIFTGTFLFFVLKSSYKDEETGKIYRKIERFYPQSQKEVFLRALKTRLDSIDTNEEDKGNGLRMDIYTDGKEQVYIQLFEYVPYNYIKCSDFYSFTHSESAKLLA